MEALTRAIDTGLSVDGVSVRTAKGVPLLRDVRFDLPAGGLLAVVGPSGAGKTTLLRALLGTRPADQGTVRCRGRDLYADYDRLRRTIGFVPQDDVLHGQLTVRRSLDYAARLRLSTAVSPEQRSARIAHVLDLLSLTAQADQRVDTLSGGQRKRTSLALELLTDPELLLLDEPTSGLDPGLDRTIMSTLRGLADGGRTVVVVTHNMSNLMLCDRVLVLAPGGWVAFYGSPDDALAHFGQPDFEAVFQRLATRDGERWGVDFAEARHRSAATPVRVSPAPAPVAPVDVAGPAGPPGCWRQFRLHCHRYVAVIAADRRYLALLGALPLLLSLLSHVVPGSTGYSVDSAAGIAAEPQPRLLLMVLMMGGALMGIAVSLRELVKERPIHLRERAVGLSVGAYLGSKLAVLGAICVVQATAFVALVGVGHRGPNDLLVLGSPVVELAVPVVAVTVVGMVIGLAISAGIANADRAMPPLVLLIMVQLIACGGMFGLGGRAVVDQLSWLVPARWAFAMGASTLDLSAISRESPDPLWRHTASTWWFDALVLVAVGCLCLAALGVLVRRQQPGPRRRRRPARRPGAGNLVGSPTPGGRVSGRPDQVTRADRTAEGASLPANLSGHRTAGEQTPLEPAAG